MQDDITESFNASAQKYMEETIDADMLLTKYSLLMKYRAQDMAEKQKLSDILLDSALGIMKRYADPEYGGYLSASDIASVTQLLTALSSAENAPYLPSRAAAAVADMGIRLVARGEEMADNNDRDKDKMTQFAQACLAAADTFRGILDHQMEDISTSKSITPARRLVLRAKDDGAAQP